jgi:PST family polysaccharide transporter
MTELFRFINEGRKGSNSIRKNLSYLTLFQVVNIAVPLVTYPHLIRTLGKDIYGLIVFSQAVISYLVIFVNFGINTLVVKDISINRDNKLELGRIVSNVYLLKGILFIVAFVVLYLVLKILPQARGQEKLFYLSMCGALYEFLVPFWYFQGIEKMKHITYLNFVSRSVFMILIFYLIDSPDDYLKVPVINALGAIITGISGLFVIFYVHKLKVVYEGIFGLYVLLREALNFFVSDVAIKLFAGSNKVIVGSVLGYSDLALYDLADKIIHVFRVVPLNIVRDGIYPIVAKSRNIKIVQYTSWIMGFYSTGVILLIVFFAPNIINVLGGKDMLGGIPFLKFGSLIIFTTHISNYYLTVGLWSFGHVRLFRNIMLYSAIMYVLVYYLLWEFEIINLYTVIAVPMLVDVYNIIHIYLIFKKNKFDE